MACNCSECNLIFTFGVILAGDNTVFYIFLWLSTLKCQIDVSNVLLFLKCYLLCLNDHIYSLDFLRRLKSVIASASSESVQLHNT